MRLSSHSVSSPNQTNFNRSGSRLRKKHKRLDAICEEEYNRNHNEHDEGNGRAETSNADIELRRSTRMRRAPVLLDVSPPPVKKRRKINKGVSLSVETKDKSRTPTGKENADEKPGELETPDNWKTRLRSRARNVGFGVEEKGSESSGKRRLFEEESVGLDEKKGDLGAKKLIVYSKRVGRVKSLNHVVKEGREEMLGVKDESEREVVRFARNEGDKAEKGTLALGCGISCGNKNEIVGGDEKQVVEREEREETCGLLVKEGHVIDGNAKKSERELEELETSQHVEESECDGPVEASESDRQVEASESDRQVEASESDRQVEASESGKQIEEAESSKQMEEAESSKQVEESESGKQLEELRDDKQVEEFGGEEEVGNQQDIIEVNGNVTNEVQNGEHDNGNVTSLVKSDERPMQDENVMKVAVLNPTSTDILGKPRIKQGRRCGLCGGGTDGKPPKPLLQDTGESENEAYSGSSASEEPNYDIWDGFGDEPGWLGRLLGPINDRYGIAGIWVHQHCAVWSPEVYFAGLGHLKNVRAALCRGRALKCTRCGRPGATIGCRVDRCPKTYHLPCARANGCIFDHRKFLIACTDHRHLFQPYGSHYVAQIKKLKARKMKQEMRKLSDDASRKDIEAEEKWLENCGEDEEFLKRESKRLHRDLLRVAPVYIGGPDSENYGNVFEGWESVAGLQDVIRCMKEVVILPLLYPEFFDNLGLTPPRGVLLHGYPGTGKTLVVRALIGSCARGDKRIAYFARKGADCLGKYVGDAERQLRLLFQVAERSQPSVIFFDEIDGLAPCRTRQQDQTHNSVVSTLLALMDGLKSRGSVVVIGATNRPDAIDPALRRPGRFDREIYFPLPSLEDRAAILSLHTQRWPKPVSGSLLKWVAQRTVGFAGADLQALCTQVAIIALKRNFPLQEMLSAAEKKESGANRVPLPSFAVEERDWLEALLNSPPPCSRREAGIAANDLVCSPLPTHLIPCMLQPLSTLLVSLLLDERVWLPPPLFKAAKMVKSVIVSALVKKKLPTDCWWSHVNDFLHEADVAKDVETRLSCAGIVIGEDNFPASDAFSDDVGYNCFKSQPSIVHNGGTRSDLLQNTSFRSSKLGYRILIDGSARSGQRHLASCLLHCFVGNVEIQKIDLATVSQEGHGDVVQGMTQILMKCASVGSCIVFMPRIDLWAVETFPQVNEKSDPSSTKDQFSEKKESCFAHDRAVEKENKSCSLRCKLSDIAGPRGPSKSSSHAWSLFTEQVESISVSTSLMILATSEVPYAALPHKIKQFFKSGYSSESTPAKHTGPRFSVEVGRNFNRDVLINLSAAALSRDLIQSFVRLIHQRSHAHSVRCKEDKPCDFLEGHADTGHEVEDHSTVNEVDDRMLQRPDEFSKKVLPPVNRTLKVKSSLLLAISTFGYQILRYPHFAELCWVTSKLKEGPYAEINGHWKGWSFNTCIIRSSNSVDKVAIACSNSNIKIKEKIGVVRGLVAVGLSAYRGAYTSPREVSFEVRKVLEILVGQINAKIHAGKDRYQYVRILSQVAYLEDMVDSWAYGLQSLEVDGQMKVGDPKLTVPPLHDHHTSVDPVLCEGCKPNVSGKSPYESEQLEEMPQEDCVELSRGDGPSGCHNSDEILADDGNIALSCHVAQDKDPDNSAATDQLDEAVVSEEGPAHNIVLRGHVALDKDPNNAAAAAANNSDNKYMNGLESTKNGPCDADETGNPVDLDGDAKEMEHSNVVAVTDSIVPTQNGLCSSAELHGINFAGSRTGSNQVDGLSFMDTGITSNDGDPYPSVNLSSSKTASHYTDSGALCVYGCCSECRKNLHGSVQKIVNDGYGLNRSNWTVDDIHDIVSSLSVDLLASVKKVAESESNSLDENQRHDNQGKLSDNSELSNCHCTSGKKLFVPVECVCHPISGCETGNASISGLRPDFVFRDGVMVPLDSDRDVSYHCKFETLCLCSLMESIVMKKQPFD